MQKLHIESAKNAVDVSLQEHVIISEDGYYSYRKAGYFDSE
ncbi:hypothetical protein [Dissulfurispira thermophila]|uniref:RadC-like JAB domain-containing protein n=1 Tax=hot springs metagenome TaxID=433727 RepID=A0A5J4L8D5_9ZZZZ|nr:hypothetical protein [Dissulfurispira thermophila]